MVAHNPLHRSGQADFPHPALASGDDAKSPQGVWVTDAGRGEPPVDEPQHSLPENPTVLASSRQGAMPVPTDLEAKDMQRSAVHGHAVVADVSTDNRPEPLSDVGNGVVHATLQLGFHLAQFRAQSFPNGLPKYREHSVALLLHANVREAQEVECLRFPLTTLVPVDGRERSELQKACLVGMQLQIELSESLLQLHPEPLGIRPMLEANHYVVGKTHDDDITARVLPAPVVGHKSNA